MLVLGVNLPSKKKIFVALTYIYGIGEFISLEICKSASIDKDKRVHELSESDVSSLFEVLKHHALEGDLRNEVVANVRHLKNINCYRGMRHKKGLPVRGQRTHTNARTSKKLLKGSVFKSK